MGNLGGISKILIENFRSIKKLEIGLENYCTFIGANNAGKSNILRALNLILGEGWPTDKSFTEDDFYEKDTRNIIEIRVGFKNPHIAHYQRIYGLKLTCKASQNDTDLFETEFFCLDQNEKALKYSNHPNAKYMRPTKDIKSHCPLIYVDTVRNYGYQHTPSNRWSVLRKIFNKVNEEFVKGEDSKEFKKRIDSAYELLRNGKFGKIEEALKKNLEGQINTFGSEDKIKLDFKSYDPANAFKSLQLHINQMGIDSLAEDVGSGLQSLIVTAIFRTYMEMEKNNGVLVIEEPESFLHPQKVRYLASVLKETSKAGQVIVSTHSPVFADMQNPETIFLVKRSSTEGTQISKIRSLEDSHRATLKTAMKFNLNTNEMFFARLVIFVEGQSEFYALPILLKPLDIDLDKEESSIIMCNGKKSISSFARVAKDLDIPFLILMDKDTGKIEENNNNNRIVKEFGEDKVHMLDPDLEGVLGLEDPGDGNKVLRAIENAEALQRTPDKTPEPIKLLANKIQSILGKPSELSTQGTQLEESEIIDRIIQPIIEDEIRGKFKNFKTSQCGIDDIEIDIEKISSKSDIISIKGNVSAFPNLCSSKPKESFRAHYLSDFQAELKCSEHEKDRFDLLNLNLDKTDWV